MWICKTCGQEIEDQFDSCWKCAANDGSQPPDGSPKYAKACIGCGSEKLVKNVEMICLGFGGLQVELRTQYCGQGALPLVFPRVTASPLTAVVCGECGLISFYATRYTAIYEQYLDEQKETPA